MQNVSNATMVVDREAIFRQRLQLRLDTIVSNAVVQFVVFMIPSFILNSLIVASYIRSKFVRTPFNLLFACFSGMTLVGHVITCLISFIGLPIALVRGDCVLAETSVFVRSTFLSVFAPLTVVCIAVAQCLIITSRKGLVTYRGVVVTLVVIWTFGFIRMCFLGWVTQICAYTM